MPSTVISKMLYDPKTHILQLRFISGNVYDYKNVPEKTYKELKSAASKGSYFNTHIKDHFDFEKKEQQ